MLSEAKPRAAKRPSRVVQGKRAAARPKRAAGNGKRSTATKRKHALGAGKPVLLAGGNPQVAKADGDAPVQAYLTAMPGWKRDVGRRLDALIARTVPGVRKAVKWNSPFYGIEGQGWFLSFHCFTRFVRVTFFRGTSLVPLPPGTSKQKEVRYLDIHEDDRFDEVLAAGWIRQASELPGWLS
ncbi:MAG: histidine kinase [Candidatus Rokuibacteriota bacterium]|nr:MAG: histidine kinase [Candidatus Rokubacteria bacterium]